MFKKITIALVTSIAAVVGTVAVAGPASANAGNRTCPISIRLTARGWNPASGATTADVNGTWIATNIPHAEVTFQHPTAFHGTWRVSGAGASTGIGFCS